MPKYNKKITRPMDYDEFKEGIQNYRCPNTNKPLSQQHKAFLTILFLAGVRVSEALALTSNDISCTKETIWFEFFRLKGSKQTDPIPLPRIDSLEWVCEQEGKLFSFTRCTAHRIVKRVWSDLYPHYFRQNRFTDVAERFPLATVVNFSGLSPLTVQHYIAKVDIKKVGKALQEEVS